MWRNNTYRKWSQIAVKIRKIAEIFHVDSASWSRDIDGDLIMLKVIWVEPYQTPDPTARIELSRN